MRVACDAVDGFMIGRVDPDTDSFDQMPREILFDEKLRLLTLFTEESISQRSVAIAARACLRHASAVEACNP